MLAIIPDLHRDVTSMLTLLSRLGYECELLLACHSEPHCGEESRLQLKIKTFRLILADERSS